MTQFLKLFTHESLWIYKALISHLAINNQLEKRKRITTTGREVQTPIHALVITITLISGQTFTQRRMFPDQGSLSQAIAQFESQLLADLDRDRSK